MENLELDELAAGSIMGKAIHSMWLHHCWVARRQTRALNFLQSSLHCEGTSDLCRFVLTASIATMGPPAGPHGEMQDGKAATQIFGGS